MTKKKRERHVQLDSTMTHQPLEKLQFDIKLGQSHNIIGVGADLCNIQRMQRLLNKWQDVLGRKILSIDEFDLWQIKQKSAAFLAKRWAGKEAVVKALGTGFSQNIRWREISILNEHSGKPYVEFLGQTKGLLSSNKGYVHCFISLADEKNQALAFCVAIQISSTILDT